MNQKNFELAAAAVQQQAGADFLRHLSALRPIAEQTQGLEPGFYGFSATTFPFFQI
jgi:hypothetical protein